MCRDVFPAQNFSLIKTLESGQCFRYERNDSNTRAAEYRVMSGDSCCIVSQPYDGATANYLDVEILGGSYDLIRWREYFGLTKEQEEATDTIRYLLTTRMPRLSKVYEHSKGIRILRQDPWETLVTFIISQRNNIPRIKQNVSTLCSIWGTSCYRNWDSFPTSRDLVRGSLERCGLGYRAPYVKGAAEAVSNGWLNLHSLTPERGCSSQRAVQELMRLRGVGVKVAECTALFGLGHMDLFPVDVWISRAIEEFDLDSSVVREFGTRSGLIQQYFYYYMISRK